MVSGSYYQKEVRFDEYCKTCKHANAPEDQEPCSICIDCPCRPYSHIPLKYEKDDRMPPRQRKKNPAIEAIAHNILRGKS